MNKNNYDEARNLLKEKNLTLDILEEYNQKTFHKYFKNYCIGVVLFINLMMIFAAFSTNFSSENIGVCIFINILIIPIIYIMFKLMVKFGFKILNPYDPNDELNSYYNIDKMLKTNKNTLEKFLNRAIKYKQENNL